METTSATSVSDYMVVRMPATEDHERFKESIRAQFAFMTRSFTFTSDYTYIRFHYPEYAQTAAHILAGDLVETEVLLLIQEVFGGLTIDPELLHAHRACHEGCTFCLEERAEEDGYWRQMDYACRHCGDQCCGGGCRERYDEDEDERYGYSDDEDHGCGNRCHCCGYADEEVGTRYAGYCGYSCAQEDEEW